MIIEVQLGLGWMDVTANFCIIAMQKFFWHPRSIQLALQRAPS